MQKDNHINVLSKGLNKDIHISLLDAESLREAYNFRLYTEDGNSFIATNIKGTELISALTTGFVPLGYVVAREFCYIFSYNPTTNEGEVGVFPSLNVSSFHLNGTANIEVTGLSISMTYKPLYNYYDPSLPFPVNTNRLPFRSTRFNFDLNYAVEAEARLDYDGSYNLYFTDFLNEVRIINTGISREEDGTYKLTKRMYEPSNFDDLINLKLRSDNIVKVDYVGQEFSGKLRHATYIYHFTFSIDKINETPVVASSMPVVVYETRSNSLDRGSEDSRYGDTNIAFTTSENYENTFADVTNILEVSNIDTQFKYLHVYYEIIYGVGEEKYGVYGFREPIAILGNSTLQIRHTGLEPVTMYDDKKINEFYAKIAKVKSLAQIDSRLLLFHTADIINEQAFTLLKQYANNIIIRHRKYKVSDIADFSLNLNPNALYIQSYPTIDINNGGYREPYHIYYNLGYHYGEIYQFGVQFILKGNVLTNVFLLRGNDDLDCISSFSSIPNNKGVYRFPKRSRNAWNGTIFTSNLHTNELIAIFPEFILPDWNISSLENDYVKDNVIGFKFVRLKRKKDCFGQGVIVPTYSVPFMKWGFDSYPLREVSTFIQHNNSGYKFHYGSNNFYFNSNFDKYSLYLRDTTNTRYVVPLPASVLGGANTDEADDEYQPQRTEILFAVSQHLKDPFRLAFISSDIICNERLYSTNLNNNAVGFEVVGSYRLLPSYQYKTELKPYFNVNNNAGINFCMLYTDFSYADPNIFPHLASSPNDSYARIQNYFFKGRSFFVFGDRYAANEKFTSQIQTDTMGGYKVSHPYMDTPDFFRVPVMISWNDYLGITLGDGWETATHPIQRTGALLVGGVPQLLSPNNTALNELHTPVNNNYGTLAQTVFFDCFDLSMYDDGSFQYFEPGRMYVNYVPSYNNRGFSDRAWIVDLFLDENGRQAVIQDFYDGITETNFFIPVTLNISKAEAQSNGYVVRGMNGDNYQGVWYRKIWYSKAKHDFGLGEKYLYGGMVLMAKCDNNYNPYARVRELVYVNERLEMSNNTEGNRRSFFPVYANSLIRTYANPPRIKESEGNYHSAIPMNMFKFAKSYHTEESKEYERGGNSQWGNYRVDLIYVNEPLEIQSYFPTRLYYSEKHINNSFIDNYRLVMPMSYQDYDLNLGKGTAVRVLNNRVYIIQEDGVSLISFNERQPIGEGTDVYISTSSILTPYQATLSRKYGSIHRDSVIATDNFIYFVDAKRRSICRIESEGVRDLSEGRISSFLNDIFNIYGDSRELQGAIYVRSFYNRKYDEINFVIYKKQNPNIAINIVYSEKLNVFIVHSYHPLIAFSIFDDYYALSDVSNDLITYPFDSPIHNPLGMASIYQHDISNNRNRFYGVDVPLFFHYIVNKAYEVQKIFDNIMIVSNHILPTRLFYRITDENGNIISDTIYYANGIPLGVLNNLVNRISYREHTARFSIPYTDKSSNIVGRRYRDKAIEIGIYYDTNDYVEIQKVVTIFRYSFS